MDRNKIFLLALLIVVSVFMLSVVWEFALETPADILFFGAVEEEPNRAKFEKIFGATISAAIALIIPVLMFLKFSAQQKIVAEELRGNKDRARTAEEQLSDAIDSISEGFVLYDSDDRLVLCNNMFRNLYGYSDDDLAPGVRYEYLVRRDVENGIVVDDNIGGKNYYQRRIEFRRRRTKESFDINLTDGRWVAIRERKMETGGVVGIHADITHLKRAEEAILDSEEKHRNFAADAAHELRTPLAVLRLHLDNLEDEKTANALRQDMDVMSRMVEQLLAATRLDNLAINAADEADLLKVCTNVATHLAPLAVKERRSIEVVGAENPVIVWGNSDALEQAVSNLVENAIKYSARQTTITIRVGDDASISVIDKGRGVSPEIREEIFKRFLRSDQRTGGAGLGLFIVQRTVEAHGGSIEIDDAPGGGAVFTIRLTLKDGVYS
ncbi:MAG: ATP-binding protein [Rhodospirillales bacterium]